MSSRRRPFAVVETHPSGVRTVRRESATRAAAEAYARTYKRRHAAALDAAACTVSVEDRSSCDERTAIDAAYDAATDQDVFPPGA